jgi:glycosyltransferase involved in cell wall biosynthesis
VKAPHRVLHLITDLQGGGAEALLYSLLTVDAANGHAHAVVSMLSGGPYVERITALGVPVHTLDMKRGRPSWRAVRDFRALCAQHRPTIIQSWMYHANVLSTGAVLSGLPDVIVANSDVTRVDHVRMGYRPRRWATIPNGFDVTRFRADCEARASVRAELGLPAETTLIGLVGRYDQQKDIPTFLRAASLLSQSGSTAKFLLVGHALDGQNPELMQAVAQLGLADDAHLLGFRSDIPRITAALDIATSTSISESFSNTIAEAMSCEVPCVVTDAANLPYLVGDAGIVVPRRDPAAVARAWQRLLDLGEDDRRELGRRGRHRIEARFSVQQMTEQYRALYQEVRQCRLARA